jgi:hypothetical protein
VNSRGNSFAFASLKKKKKKKLSLVTAGSCPDLNTAYVEGEEYHQLYDLKRENAVSLSYISSIQ